MNWRDDRHDAQWDDRQYNGYYDGRDWRYGPPPSALRRHNTYSYGYHPWSRGDRLGYYADRFDHVDYRRINQRRPHRGYQWVRDDRGDYLLYAIATGLIAEVIVNSGY